VRRIALGGARVDLALRISPDKMELEIENSGPEMTLTFRPPLRDGTHVSSVVPSEGVRLTSAASGSAADEIHAVCPSNRTCRITLQLAPTR
jgi:hypothetical protein